MPWKLYIDSRRRVKGSRRDTDTDFAISLPRPIPVQGKPYIDVCLIPNSFTRYVQERMTRSTLMRMATALARHPG